MAKLPALFETIQASEGIPFRLSVNDNENQINLFSCNYHKELEFLIIDKGSAVIRINDKDYLVSEGQAVIINSEEIHMGFSIESIYCRSYAVIFHPDIFVLPNTDICHKTYIQPIVEGIYRFPTHIIPDNDWQSEVLQNMRHIINCYLEKDFSYELQIKTRILDIISILVRQKKFESSALDLTQNSQIKLNRLKDIVNYVENNFANEITIEQLANIANLSSDYFYKFFKQATNKTPLRYITEVRISKACKQLTSSEQNVAEIAFGDVSFFIKTFSKIMGTTPRKYRLQR